MAKIAPMAARAPEKAQGGQKYNPGLGSLTGLHALLGPARGPSGRFIRGVALAVALMAHTAILYALVRDADELAGAAGQQLDAITVTLIHADALEAREAILPAPAPASQEPVDAEDGAPDSLPTPPSKQAEEKNADTAEEQKVPEQPVEKTEALLEAVQPPKHEASEPQAPSAAAGGMAARSDLPTASHVTAAAAASPGAVREYARYVSQALSRTKPKSHGSHGSVRVKFIIAPTGGLASAAVTKSSGSHTLDQRALDAVQTAKLPVPPPGMTMSQLTYEVPYHFR